MSFTFRQFQKAPKGQDKAKVMSGTALAYEVALATVRLCVAGRWIDRASAEEVCPTLKAKYTEAQSTIPTYFGAGRSGEGVGLWRSGDGPYPPCVENAGLALVRLEQLGHPPAAPPVPPVAPTAVAAPPARPADEDKENARKAAREAREKEKDAALRERLREQHTAEKAEQAATVPPEINAAVDDLLSGLEDETEGGDQ